VAENAIGKEYTSKVLEMAQNVIDDQFGQITCAADKIYASLKNGGVMHVFGCGHSHIFAEECFYRAGGLVPVNPIFESSAMLHEGAIKSSYVERMSGYASLILDNYDVKAREVILIYSTSGINTLPIEMALAAKEKGMTVVAVTSLNYRAVASRYKTGQRLCDVADIVINNNVPCGDALLKFESRNAVPCSSIIGITILNTMIAEVLARYEKDGRPLPVFVSGNIEGAQDVNEAFIAEYRHKIKAL